MQLAIERALILLEDDPHYPGLSTHKMQGYPGVWESYIDGANRITWEWVGGNIVLRNNCNHDILKRSP